MKKLDSDFTESDVTVDEILAKAAEKAASKKAEVDASLQNQAEAQALSRDMAEFVAELVNPKDPSKIEKMKMSDGRIILTLISYESGMVKYNTDTSRLGNEFTYARTTQANEPYFQLQNQLYKYLND